jgi:DNA adenine methylase
MPARMKTYAEPFAGGAALFFDLVDSLGGEERPWQHAVLNDQNEELIACYRAVRDKVEALIDALGAYKYDRELFYKTRDKSTKRMSDVQRGARLIFLNRTCFNGLWRVNASGKFNVPFGRYTNPRILDPDALRSASRALQGVDLRVGDFADVTRSLGAGDFVYFDPPYVPLSRTAAFTAYGKDGFTEADQTRLAEELRSLHARGAQAMLSNHDTRETRALYAGLHLSVVNVARVINSDPSKRGNTAELVVTTWDARSRPRREARTA